MRQYLPLLVVRQSVVFFLFHFIFQNWGGSDSLKIMLCESHPFVLKKNYFLEVDAEQMLPGLNGGWESAKGKNYA